VELAAWLTLAVVIAVIAGMASERAPAAFVMLAGVIGLLALGVTVAALYVLARAVEATGAVDRITAGLFPERPAGGRAQQRLELGRMLVPTATASAFLNNTPIVAMMIPRVLSWSRTTGRNASRYLMPVSFAAIVGGLVTLIGTSTNLVVSGFLEESGMPPIGLFEISRVGIPLALAAIVGLVVLTPLLLPDRRGASQRLSEDAPHYTTEMVVLGGELAGESVTDAGLRDLRGVYLVEIERNGSRIAPVPPDQVLEEHDRLVFAGDVRQVVDVQQLPGLRPAQEQHFSVVGDGPDRRFYEAVISQDSRLVGRTLKDAGFRERYGAAVVAIHRSGERVRGKLGEVVLRPGDLLLVLARQGFRRRWREHHDFIVATPLDSAAPKRPERAWLVQLLLVGLLVTAGTGMVEILTAALVVAVALVGFRVVTLGEARDSVDLNVIVLIAASFGLGAAMIESGLAATVGGELVGAIGQFGARALLAGVLLVTMALTSIVSNNAAAVLMFPIAITSATGAGLDPRPFAIAVAVGASCEFLTPIGYQTNTMIYGVGGYRFTDFARLGVPFTALTVVVALIAIPLGWPLD
jgi:di/tricarboxylate transporter